MDGIGATGDETKLTLGDPLDGLFVQCCEAGMSASSLVTGRALRPNALNLLPLQ
jgi:hypothetical protein